MLLKPTRIALKVKFVNEFKYLGKIFSFYLELDDSEWNEKIKKLNFQLPKFELSELSELSKVEKDHMIMSCILNLY